MNRSRLEEQLLLHEGLRLRAYLDTEDCWTVGVGYNLSARGTDDLRRILGRAFPDDLSAVTLTKLDALRVLRADIDRIERAVKVQFPFYNELDEVRQRVVMDLAFNLGFRALAFKQTRAAIETRNWSRAVRELYKSKWARQVDDGPGGHHGRADRLGQMLLTGHDYTQ